MSRLGIKQCGGTALSDALAPTDCVVFAVAAEKGSSDDSVSSEPDPHF